MISRLQDPHKLVSDKELYDLAKKVESAMTIMARDIPHGGNPFLYGFTVTKEHELAVKIESFEVHTAATDGVKFYWNPDFLAKLNKYELPIIMEHETIHLVSEHAQKFAGKKNQEAWGLAIDFVTNARIEDDHRKINRGSKLSTKRKIWGPNIGEPVSIRDLISIKKGLKESPKKCLFVDMGAVKRSPEDVYKEILPYFDRPPQQQPKTTPAEEGDEESPQQTLDSHIPCKLDNQEILEELLVATERANAIDRGTVPSYVEDIIGELTNPTVDLSEHIRMACLQAKCDGMRNRWKRPRRRSFAIGQYLPTRIGHKPRWLCLLDTSGSMSKEQIAEGVSQLQSLGNETEGYIIPCDAAVHWDHIDEVNNASDLVSTKIIGRGGTVFDDFFKEFPDRLGTDFDVIIVITDGLVEVSKDLDPGIDCIWAITSSQQFTPPFGRAVKLCAQS
jgi:predicted metal-dependent peptidase